MQEVEQGSEQTLGEYSLDRLERLRHSSQPDEIPTRKFSWDGGSRLHSLPNSAAQDIVEENYTGEQRND